MKWAVRGFIDVEYPAWVVSAYPAFVPEILDMVTLDDVAYNTAVTQFAYRTDIYGTVGTFSQPQIINPEDLPALMHWQASNLAWNSDYKPWFYRDIWPILFRADEYTYLTNVLMQSNYPHNQTQRGNFDPTKLSIPPSLNHSAYTKGAAAAVAANQAGELISRFYRAVACADRSTGAEYTTPCSRAIASAIHS